ncbi:unnamed protein product [Caenorhabditis bovis]|uniref:Ground-like domain-containing protein n=1 Tax=Caenorhabditis bovis TaxID=2654633 RepID=A0A8S1EHC7_9PELO|nr:unnamed protein product [Caenorhabditis bovis]
MNSILVILILTICSISACPGLFGGLGGCGGGSGGCGGGCGRRKRSIQGSEEFFGIASSQEDMLCNSPEMRKTMNIAMRPSPVDSSKAIQTALEEHGLFRYVVVCSEAPFVYAVRIDTAYCSSRNKNHFCQAFAI